MKRLAVFIVLAAGLVPTEAAPASTAFRCHGSDGIAAMENSYIVEGGGGACWGHLGHHTYALGGLFQVGPVTDGRVFSVEVQFSPPTDVIVGTTQAPVAFEVSVDGRTWTTIHQIGYELRGATRREIFFDFDGGGAEARFIRIRQPRSAAQGLSGYLDASSFDAVLTPVFEGPIIAVPGPRTYECTSHIMERFFDTHPCWAGGVNRYDAPSAFHTYPLGIEAALESVTGTVTLLPWRSDDYTSDGGSATSVAGEVQTSVDGIAWDAIGTFEGVFGRPIAFDITGLDGAPARFVRLVAERHHGWNRHPALKHVRGFLVDSTITVAAPLLS
jgi:hypothetical protein